MTAVFVIKDLQNSCYLSVGWVEQIEDAHFYLTYEQAESEIDKYLCYSPYLQIIKIYIP